MSYFTLTICGHYHYKTSMSSRSHKTPSGQAVTTLIVEVFRLNGRLLAAGDKLVAPLGLTSARWQVLGVVANLPAAGTVAQLARYMGVYRQGVQRIVNELTDEALLEFRENPDHRRAKLVALTKTGRKAFEAVDRLQKPWADALSDGLNAASLIAASRILTILTKRLKEMQGAPMAIAIKTPSTGEGSAPARRRPRRSESPT
jgi:DNA-binding MarR family transcriptional regulator